MIEWVDCEFKAPGKLKAKIGAIMGAARQYDMASVCREYLKEHPHACVVNIDCGVMS